MPTAATHMGGNGRLRRGARAGLLGRRTVATTAVGTPGVADWVKRVYTHRRRHSPLGMLTRNVLNASPSDGRSCLTATYQQE
jgi:hypothetical protein